MEIALITPLSPDEVIPDREADRLFMELVQRGDKGEFNVEAEHECFSYSWDWLLIG